MLLYIYFATLYAQPCHCHMARSVSVHTHATQPLK